MKTDNFIFKLKTLAVSRRLLCALTALVIVASAFPVLRPVSNAVPAERREGKIIVSMGDSYSSGEGIEPFYGQDADFEDKRLDPDWIGHRSERSWGGRLKLPAVDGTMAENKDTNWFFVAASGATTHHLKNHQFKTTSSNPFNESKSCIDPQLNVFSLSLSKKMVSYVTITIGGNDAHFVDVIKKAALRGKYFFPNALPDMINDIWDEFYEKGGIQDRLETAYKDIEEAAGLQACIIVAGYPTLLSEEGSGGFFSSAEANTINKAVIDFNREIEALVTACYDKGMNIRFASVLDEFRGHEAYTDNEYITRVDSKNDQDIEFYKIISDYSMHPNELGAKAYAKCVQRVIDEVEAAKHPKEFSMERDAVLVLDTSGSMGGTSINETREASEKFISSVLEQDASIGIVAYSDDAIKIADFSKNEDYLTRVVNNIGAYGGTNIEAGLLEAEEMLDESMAKKKIIVLMSDGEPNYGKVDQELVDYTDQLREKGIIIYTLGFFQKLYDKYSAEFLMEKLANEGCHYEVTDADDLVFFFEDIAYQISGDNVIYVRIACPVDVTVSYNGETLSSDPLNYNNRTSFGTLTFNTNEVEEEVEGIDNRIKILRLKEGPKYNIEIAGTGEGTMNYSIGFMDSEGNYSDMREFNDIPITPETRITTVAARASSSVMSIDSNGDGKTDLKYKAGQNSAATLVKTNPLKRAAIITLIVVLVAAAAAAAVLIIMKLRKKKAAANSVVFCTVCGYRNSSSFKFCEQCGNKLK